MDPTLISAIEAADAERARATLAKDADTLGRLFGDDLLYVHGSAVAESKALYIERVCTGHYDYEELTSLRRNFRAYGDVVLVDGDVRIQVVSGGNRRDFVSRYLQAWAKRNGAWQMVSCSRHPCRLQPEPARVRRRRVP
jgi:ketosteroid isomerase-like protein